MNFAVGGLSLRCWVMDEILGTNHYGFAGFLWLGWSGGWGRPNYDPLFHTILYFGSFVWSPITIGLSGFIRWTFEPKEAYGDRGRSEEHTSELQSHVRISYAVFCLKKKKTKKYNKTTLTKTRLL